MAEVSPTPSSIPPAPKQRAILDLPELYARGPSYGAVFGLALLFLAAIAYMGYGFDKRFDGFDKRFDGVDRHFDATERRIDRVEQRLDALTLRLDAVTKELSELRTEVRVLATEVKAQRETMERGFADIKQLLQQRRP
jgi:septal ring factor EnvC (AmiA/AmiB activator)